MEGPTAFRIVTLPKLPNTTELDAKFTALAEKLRELRLRSLEMAPDAFASQSEDESQRGLDHTLNRMSNSKAVHFIALGSSNSEGSSFDGQDDVQRMIESRWLGLIVLLGPQEDNDPDGHPKGDPFQRMTAAGREEKFLSAESTHHTPAALHFHLNAMFVDVAARGCGLGMALIEAALARAEAEATRSNAGLRVTINVYEHNVSAHRLYEKAGFRIVQKRPSLTRGPEVTAVDMELTRSIAS